MKNIHRFIHREAFYRKQGYKCIAGLDEVGRGPLAGPLVCAAVVIGEGTRFHGLTDSKLLSEAERERLSKLITEKCAYGIGLVTVEEVERFGLTGACQQGFLRALRELPLEPDFILIDGRDPLSLPYSSESIIKGDQKVRSIAAASVVAKVYRDNLMKEYAKEFPEYGFEKHKGYGTAEHLDRLREHGATPLHRKNFKPVFELQNVQQLALS